MRVERLHSPQRPHPEDLRGPPALEASQASAKSPAKDWMSQGRCVGAREAPLHGVSRGGSAYHAGNKGSRRRRWAKRRKSAAHVPPRPLLCPEPRTWMLSLRSCGGEVRAPPTLYDWGSCPGYACKPQREGMVSSLLTGVSPSLSPCHPITGSQKRMTHASQMNNMGRDHSLHARRRPGLPEEVQPELFRKRFPRAVTCDVKVIHG